MEKQCNCGNGSGCCGGHGHAHHEHAHGEGGCCGGHGHAHHEHGHGEGCGCGGHHHAHDDFEETIVIESAPATAKQLDFLRNFQNVAPLPIAKYIVKSSKEHSFESVALRDVCLRSAADSIPLIKETAAFLQSLAASNLIAIDYDAPLGEESYAHFYDSDSFMLFEETVAHGAEQEAFLGDIAALEAGSINLTAWGKEQIAQ